MACGQCERDRSPHLAAEGAVPLAAVMRHGPGVFVLCDLKLLVSV